jgi:hypothetical protein
MIGPSLLETALAGDLPERSGLQDKYCKRCYHAQISKRQTRQEGQENACVQRGDGGGRKKKLWELGDI